jgi:hypothetical protein
MPDRKTAIITGASRGIGAGRSDFLTKIPPGYRDWKLVSVAHEEGNLHSFAAILGNDVAIKAYRERRHPFPDGAVIAALHYGHVGSDENNKVFGQQQSFVPVPPQTFSSCQGLKKLHVDRAALFNSDLDRYVDLLDSGIATGRHLSSDDNRSAGGEATLSL